MRKLLILIISLWVSAGAMAQNELFKNANQAYTHGEYKKAAQLYDSILKSGKASEGLYFNLANAYYKQNQLAESIFYYEKALQLDPKDKAVQNNLAFAEKRKIDAIEQRSETGLIPFLKDTIASYTVTTWAWIGVVFSILMALCFLAYRFSPRAGRKKLFFTLMLICFFSSGVGVFLAYQQNAWQEQREYAIVYKNEITVKPEPNSRSNTAFQLHEGTKVQILENFNGYYKIELADGQIGWLKKETVKSLNQVRFRRQN